MVYLSKSVMCYVLCFYSSYKLKYREIKKLVYIKEKESRGKGRGQIYIIFKTKIIRNGQTCYQRTHVRYPSKVQHFIYRDITTFQKRGAPCPVNFRHKPFQFPNYTVVEDNAFNILKCLMGIWHMTKTMILWIQDCTREFFFFFVIAQGKFEARQWRSLQKNKADKNMWRPSHIIQDHLCQIIQV